MSVGLVGSKGVRGRLLTIANDFVTGIALYVTVEGSAKTVITKVWEVLTQRSQHRKHLSRTQGRRDPASPAEPRPMTGSLECFGTRIGWQTIVLPLFVVHKSPRDPSYGRGPSIVLPRRQICGAKSAVLNSV